MKKTSVNLPFLGAYPSPWSLDSCSCATPAAIPDTSPANWAPPLSCTRRSSWRCRKWAWHPVSPSSSRHRHRWLSNRRTICPVRISVRPVVAPAVVCRRTRTPGRSDLYRWRAPGHSWLFLCREDCPVLFRYRSPNRTEPGWRTFSYPHTPRDRSIRTWSHTGCTWAFRGARCNRRSWHSRRSFCPCERTDSAR